MPNIDIFLPAERDETLWHLLRLCCERAIYYGKLKNIGRLGTVVEHGTARSFGSKTSGRVDFDVHADVDPRRRVNVDSAARRMLPRCTQAPWVMAGIAFRP